MSTEELKEALKRQKAGFVPSDYGVMLSQLLNMDEATIARVTFAYQQLINHANISNGALYPFWRERLDNELREAIQFGVQQGANASHIAQAIMAAHTITVDTALLLPRERMHDVCNGCSERIECMADTLHTPEECYTDRKSRVTVFPLTMTKTEVTVEASQPRGKYTIPVNKVRLPFLK